MVRRALYAWLATFLLATALAPASAETACPPARSRDCDRWYFEQADKALTDVVTAAYKSIEEFAKPETKQEAKAKLMDAHRAWTGWRDLECQAASAWIYINPSAQPREQYTLGCLHNLTVRRIDALRQRYRLKN